MVLLFLMPLFATAQQPFGKYATWTFYWEEIELSGITTLTYEKDSVYLGENWQVLKWKGRRILVQTTNGIIYYVLEGQKAVLYNMNATVGQSYYYAKQDTTFGCYTHPKATVTAVGYDTVNGFPMKYHVLKDEMDTILINGTPRYQVTSGYTMQGKIYDRVGYWPGIFTLIEPEINACNGVIFGKTSYVYTYRLRCYSDADVFMNFSNKNCWYGLGNADLSTSSIKIYPNPSAGFVFIDTENEVVKTEIFNTAGQKLSVYQNEKTLALPLAHGLYFLHITFKNGGTVVQKVNRN